MLFEVLIYAAKYTFKGGNKKVYISTLMSNKTEFVFIPVKIKQLMLSVFHDIGQHWFKVLQAPPFNR